MKWKLGMLDGVLGSLRVLELEEPDEEAAAAWATELEHRSREVMEGKVQTVEWSTARTEILRELGERRARRAAP